MVIYGVYIVSKSGGLIFHQEHNMPKVETEKTFSYPLDLQLSLDNKKVVVAFGQRDNINGMIYLMFYVLLCHVYILKWLEFAVGHVLLSINGMPVIDKQTEDGRDVFEILEKKENYPLSLKFGRPKMTTNEKIFLASMFYPLFAIASQLSPEPKSSGIETLEADTFKLYCFQTLTGLLYNI